MGRSRWRVGLALTGLVIVAGCGGGPWLARADQAPEGALVLTAPEQYRGNSALSMRFQGSSQVGYAVSALHPDVARIDVVLLVGGEIQPLPPIPVSMPAGSPGQSDPGVPIRGPIMLPPPPQVTPAPPPVGKPTEPAPVPDVRNLPTGKPLVPPDYVPPHAILKASVSRTQLEDDPGGIVFAGLKAGTYTVVVSAHGHEGQMLGQTSRAARVHDGQTTALDASFLLGWLHRAAEGNGGGTAVDAGPMPVPTSR